MADGEQRDYIGLHRTAVATLSSEQVGRFMRVLLGGKDWDWMTGHKDKTGQTWRDSKRIDGQCLFRTLENCLHQGQGSRDS
jgi:hypothetical protein